MKRIAAVVAALVACVPLAMQGSEAAKNAESDLIVREDLEQTGEINASPALALHRSDLFHNVDGNVLIHGLPVLTLLDGRRFPISSDLGRMGFSPFDVAPLAFFNAVEVQPYGASPRYGSDATGGVVDLRLNRVYSGGEMGIFYGKSGGKYGQEDFQAYIIGGVGNDKFHITAGAAYQESNGRGPGYRYYRQSR